MEHVSERDNESIKSLGLDPNALNRLIRTIEKDIAAELYDGAVCIVGRHGEIGLKNGKRINNMAQNSPNLSNHTKNHITV